MNNKGSPLKGANGLFRKVFAPYSDTQKRKRNMSSDPKGPWWKATDLPTFTTHFDDSWPGLGLQIRSLEGGPPLLEKTHKACLKEDEKVADFFERFTKQFPELRCILDDKNLYRKKETQRTWITEDSYVRMYFDGDSRIETTLVTNDETRMAKSLEWLDQNTTKALPKGRVHVLVTTSEGPAFHNMGVGGQKLERENYDPAVLKGYDRIIKDLKSSEPAGRVAILDGPPGTGKTYLIRGLIDEVPDVVVVIIQASMVDKLAEPSLLPALMELHRGNGGEKAIVFIIEDADEVLAPRAADNMSGVSTVLNLGDGILGKLLDIRIVATTNQARQEIDEAILRPGRLSASVQVGHLSREQISEIYKRLTGKEQINQASLTLAEVYQLARQDGWEPPPKKKRVGFQSEDSPDPDDY